MKQASSISMIIIGLLGTATSIYAMPNDIWRTIAFGVFVLLMITGLFALIAQQINVLTAWSILKNSRILGIQRIHIVGLSGKFPPYIINAKTIRIMAVSGGTIIKNVKNEIIHSLRDRKSNIYILLAQPGSPFVGDIEQAESQFRAGQISLEIENVRQLLREYRAEAVKNLNADAIGKIFIGHYSTHLRVSLILCDDTWGWLTLNLPPKRAVHSVSLELTNTPNGLLNDTINHFEAAWNYAADNNQVQEIR